MAQRVAMATKGWGQLTKVTGNKLEIVANKSVTLFLAGSATPATHYSSLTGGTSSTAAFNATSEGVLNRFLDEGSYDLVVDGISYRVEAIAGNTVTTLAAGGAGSGAIITTGTAVPLVANLAVYETYFQVDANGNVIAEYVGL